MNKSLKYTLIGIVVILAIILGVKAFSHSSKEASDTASNDTSASSSVISSIINSELQKDSEKGTDEYANAPKDKNGCIISANYVWDANLGSCVPASKASTSSTSSTSKPTITTTTTTSTNTTTTTTVKSSSTKPVSVPASIAENSCRSNGGEWSTTFRECLNVDNQICSDIGGKYNVCASACRHDPDAEVCPTYCVEVCTIR